MTSDPRLAGSDIQTDGRGVVVLEVVEVGRAGVADLVRDGLASRAGEGGDGVVVARRDGEGTKLALDTRGVAVAGRLLGRGVQRSEANLAVTAEAERRGLEVFLLGEEEDERALLARVRRGDVEVKERRDGRSDGAIVRGARSLAWSGRVNRDDQVRELVVALLEGSATSSRAGGRLGSRSAGRRRDARLRSGSGSRSSRFTWLRSRRRRGARLRSRGGRCWCTRLRSRRCRGTGFRSWSRRGRSRRGRRARLWSRRRSSSRSRLWSSTGWLRSNAAGRRRSGGRRASSRLAGVCVQSDGFASSLGIAGGVVDVQFSVVTGFASVKLGAAVVLDSAR